MESTNYLRTGYHRKMSQLQPQLINNHSSSATAMPASLAAENGNGESAATSYYSSVLTWPPRSYTCTFCRKGLRSAQALGGHMNVHRRERAKLRRHYYSPAVNRQNIIVSSMPPRTTASALNLNLKLIPGDHGVVDPAVALPSSFSPPRSTTQQQQVRQQQPVVASFPTREYCLDSPGAAVMGIAQRCRWAAEGAAAMFDHFRVKLRRSAAGGLSTTDQECNITAGHYGHFRGSGKGEEDINADDGVVRSELEMGCVFGDGKEDLDLELRLGYK